MVPIYAKIVLIFDYILWQTHPNISILQSVVSRFAGLNVVTSSVSAWRRRALRGASRGALRTNLGVSRAQRSIKGLYIAPYIALLKALQGFCLRSILAIW